MISNDNLIGKPNVLYLHFTLSTHQEIVELNTYTLQH